VSVSSSTTLKHRKGEILMAASITIEEERGTYAGSPHPHNGYYAGDFSRFPAPVGSVPPPLEDWLS